MDDFCLSHKELRFQLGHVFSDMEIKGDNKSITFAKTRFQLGHVFSDMEIAAYFSRLRLLTEC